MFCHMQMLGKEYQHGLLVDNPFSHSVCVYGKRLYMADSHDNEPIRHMSMQKIGSVCVCVTYVCAEVLRFRRSLILFCIHTHTHNLLLILSEDSFIECLGLRDALWTRRVTERLFGALINTYKNAPGALQSNEDHHNRNVGSTQPKLFISQVPFVLQQCHVLI